MDYSNRRQGADDNSHSAIGNVGQCEGQNGEANEGRPHSGGARAFRHTPEPWAIAAIKISRMEEPIITSGESLICKLPALSNCGGAVNERAGEIIANAERIISCVNACEGINPAAVPEMVKALEWITTGKAAEEYPLTMNNYEDGRYAYPERMRAIRERCLSALAKAKEA